MKFVERGLLTTRVSGRGRVRTRSTVMPCGVMADKEEDEC
jgi:hypothetical protein